MKIFLACLSVICVVLLISVVLTGCGGGNSPSTSTSTPTALAAPTKVTIVPGNAQATIAWPAVDGASSYNIYWSTTVGVTPVTGTKITGATSPYTLAELTNGTTYYFVVAAVNANGESTGDTMSVVPAPSISVTQAGDNAFTLQASGLGAPAGFDITVGYDISRLSNPRVVQESLTSGAMLAVNTNAPGVVRFAVISTKAMNGSGAVVTISFDRIGDSPGAITVKGSIINLAGKNLPVVFSGWAPPGFVATGSASAGPTSVSGTTGTGTVSNGFSSQ